MAEPFFENPILNSPYHYPGKHWELDEKGQPTQKVLPERRKVDFITPIPKAKHQKGQDEQTEMLLPDEGGLSSKEQRYQVADTINRLRHHVDQWRLIPNSNDWRVTPETARLLQHWRYHSFKLKERMDLSKGGRALLQGRGPELNTLETEGQMLQRVMPELMGLKQVMVLNDEAHHCYREKPASEEE